ncbi:hypothetical protein [Sporanaerobacter acetigenes]|uniref:hypothetical protein n=1 Tax=Sporanaerobacter acetigenes TaxID=165813 RepID=UPI0013564BE9|nr:hypothetical protein [Sporanaerobacter acetigenes]
MKFVFHKGYLENYQKLQGLQNRITNSKKKNNKLSSLPNNQSNGPWNKITNSRKKNSRLDC